MPKTLPYRDGEPRLARVIVPRGGGRVGRTQRPALGHTSIQPPFCSGVDMPRPPPP